MITPHEERSNNSIFGNLSLVPWGKSPRDIDQKGDYLFFLIVAPFRNGVDTFKETTANEAFATALRLVLNRVTGNIPLGAVRVLGITLDGYKNVWSDQEIREITTGLPDWQDYANGWLEGTKNEADIDLLVGDSCV